MAPRRYTLHAPNASTPRPAFSAEAPEHRPCESSPCGTRILGHRAAIVTAYGAGLRISETVAVKVGDIKSDKKLLHIPSGKGGSERMAPLPDGVIDYLRGYWKNIWPQPASWLFYGASPDVPIQIADVSPMASFIAR